MAPNTRKFLIGSTLVVVAGLCTGLVAYYGGVLPGRQPARSELAYIPADVTAVAFADVRHIMDSEFRQKLRAVMPTGSEKDRLFDATGIDIERDIDAVVAGLPADGMPGAVVLLRGRFDQERIESVALQHGASQEQYGGRAMLLGPAHRVSGDGVAAGLPSGQVVPSMAFLDEGLLAVGDAGDLRRAIDVAVSGDGVAANADMMRVIETVSQAGDAWFVGRAAGVADQPGIPEHVRGQLAGIEWLSAVASIDASVRGLVRAETRDEKSAEDLRAVVNGALAAARMFAGQDQRAAAALNSVQASGTGLNVELSFEVPASLLDMLRPGMAPPAAATAPTALR